MSCTFVDCQVPEDRHSECAAARISKCWGRLEHQHEPRRSRGGRSCPVLLCSAHHGSCDSGLRYQGRRLGNRIDTEPGDPLSERTYVIYDRDTSEVLERVELEAVA